ncbi:MAG: type II toxin-antitoxin system prevent-host-death family antitoxin [Acetobacteraceae bacterium]
MDKAISAVEANRHFSQVLRSVREGDSFVVTAHGKPVARIAPVRAEARIADEARRQLLVRLRAAPVIDVGKWTRDELYER